MLLLARYLFWVSALTVIWPTLPYHTDTAKLTPEGKYRVRLYLTIGVADGRLDNNGDKQSFSEIALNNLQASGVSSETPGAYRIETGRSALD